MAVLSHEAVNKGLPDLLIEILIGFCVLLLSQDLRCPAQDSGRVGEIGRGCPLRFYHPLCDIFARRQPVSQVKSSVPDILFIAISQGSFLCHGPLVLHPGLHAVILPIQQRNIPIGLKHRPGYQNRRISPDRVILIVNFRPEIALSIPDKSVTWHNGGNHAHRLLHQGQISQPLVHETGNIHIEGCRRGKQGNVPGPAAALIPLGTVCGDVHKIGLETGLNIFLELIQTLIGAGEISDLFHIRVDIPGSQVLLGNLHSGNSHILKSHVGKLGPIGLDTVPAGIVQGLFRCAQVPGVEFVVLHQLPVADDNPLSRLAIDGPDLQNPGHVSPEIHQSLPGGVFPDPLRLYLLMNLDRHTHIRHDLLRELALIEPGRGVRRSVGIGLPCIVDFPVKEACLSPGAVRGYLPGSIRSDDLLCAVRILDQKLSQQRPLGTVLISSDRQAHPAGIPSAGQLGCQGNRTCAVGLPGISLSRPSAGFPVSGLTA